MNKEQKKKTAETLSEQSKWIRVGLLPIKVKPLTLAQIYDMGAAAADINADGLEKMQQVNVIACMTRHYKDARAMQRVFLACAYRKKWKRALLGLYIKSRLTTEHFSKLITIIAGTFNANFFLTSIIFLSQTKIMTEPSSTTAHGQQSEE